VVATVFHLPGGDLCRVFVPAIWPGDGVPTCSRSGADAAGDFRVIASAGSRSNRRLAEKIAMSGGELALILTAVGSMIVGLIGAGVAVLTARSAASKEELESLRKTIESLQKENVRLQANMVRLECEIEERDRRIDVPESSPEEATKAREGREKRIVELESEISELNRKVNVLETSKRRVRGKAG